MPVVGGVQRPQLGHPLDGAQAAQLGEGEVLGEPAGAPPRLSPPGGRRSANSARPATSVDSDSSFSWRTTSTPSRFTTTSGSIRSAPRSIASSKLAACARGGRRGRPWPMTTGWESGRGCMAGGRSRAWLHAPRLGWLDGELKETCRERIGRHAPVSRPPSLVTDLSALGWRPVRPRPTARRCRAARVARVDRGRLSVLTATASSACTRRRPLRRAGLSGPAVGDWVALRGELAVAVLPRTERLRPHGRRPDFGRPGGRREPRPRPRRRRAGR